MKKSMIIFSFSIALLFLGCKSNIDDTKLQEQLFDTSVFSFIEEKNLSINSNVNDKYFGLNSDGYITCISQKVFSSTGRSISRTDGVISDIVLVDLLNRKIDELNVPNFNKIIEKDIDFIKDDLNFSTEEDIIENIEMVMKIYQSEVSSLVIDNLVDEFIYSNEIGVQRSAGDYAYTYGDDTVTLAEIGACLAHPLSAAGLIKQKDKAFELTEEYMLYPKKTDEKSDAFRHTIWNIVMAKEGVGTKKQKLAWASDFATAHEEGVKYNGLASEMDLHNNKAGRNYYDINTSVKTTKILGIKIETGVIEPSYEIVGENIRAKALAAILINKEKYSLEEGIDLLDQIGENILVYIEVDTKDYTLEN